MLIIWRGAGGLVLIFGIVSALLTNIVTSAVSGENNYFAGHSWAQALSLWLTATVCWFLGRYLNGKPAKIIVNKATGQEMSLKPRHDLMFIKMEYWGAILFAIGAFVLIGGALKH